MNGIGQIGEYVLKEELIEPARILISAISEPKMSVLIS
jgi:hypothetical protein